MSDISSTEKPFSQSYVMSMTVKHMRRDLDVSIRKTFERIAEFDGNRDKSEEVFKTLASLHGLRKALDEFQSANIEAFR